MAQQVEFEQQIENLLAKEKTARLSSDANESVKILKSLAQLCFDQKEYKKFNELLVAVCKRRGQPKKAQIEIVQLAMKEINNLQLEQKLDLITSIMQVCEKKIYLEVEYARCVLLVTKFKEDDNQIVDAAKILQEVQVETYGSMDKREKLEFILYQMKIMIKKLDYVRLYIISKKIEPKNIEDQAVADLKILYYSYLVFYYKHENKYMETAESYSKILETIHKDKALADQVIDFNFSTNYDNILENTILHLIISKYSEEKVRLLVQAQQTYQYQIESIQPLNHLIKEFLGTQLISTNINEYNLSNCQIFQEKNRVQDFRKQLVQHNLRVFQLYYDQIHLNRISQLTNIDQLEIEEEICYMIDQKLLNCKIDRLTGTVLFQLKENENNVLEQWGQNINKVLDLIELTSNLIKREEEIHL